MAGVLVTRPIEEARQTAGAVAKLGHDALIDPMLTIVFREAPLPSGPFDILIVTSGNALAALRNHPDLARLRSLPLVAVGRRTAEAARGMGFTLALQLGHDLETLTLALVARWPARQRVLYLAGTDRSGDLAARLEPFGHHVTLAEVYEARVAPALQPQTQEALASGAVDTVLHYSERTARIFVACAGGPPAIAALKLRHLCLSAKVAGVLGEAGAAEVAFPERPEEDALLALI